MLRLYFATNGRKKEGIKWQISAKFYKVNLCRKCVAQGLFLLLASKFSAGAVEEGGSFVRKVNYSSLRAKRASEISVAEVVSGCEEMGPNLEALSALRLC